MDKMLWLSVMMSLQATFTGMGVGAFIRWTGEDTVNRRLCSLICGMIAGLVSAGFSTTLIYGR